MWIFALISIFNKLIIDVKILLCFLDPSTEVSESYLMGFTRVPFTPLSNSILFYYILKSLLHKSANKFCKETTIKHQFLNLKKLNILVFYILYSPNLILNLTYIFNINYIFTKPHIQSNLYIHQTSYSI